MKTTTTKAHKVVIGQDLLGGWINPDGSRAYSVLEAMRGARLRWPTAYIEVQVIDNTGFRAAHRACHDDPGPSAVK
jgi:hypothetical protein